MLIFSFDIKIPLTKKSVDFFCQKYLDIEREDYLYRQKERLIDELAFKI
jgi:hypothetical protein